MFADPAPFVYDLANDVQTTKNFALTSISGNTTKRHYHVGTPGYSVDCDISHSTVGSGRNVRGRHMLKFSVPQLDSNGAEDPSLPRGILYVVADIPNTMNHSLDPGITELWRCLVGTLRGKGGLVNYGDPTAFFTRWLEGES